MSGRPTSEWVSCPYCDKRYDGANAYAAAMHRGRDCVEWEDDTRYAGECPQCGGTEADERGCCAECDDGTWIPPESAPTECPHGTAKRECIFCHDRALTTDSAVPNPDQP